MSKVLIIAEAGVNHNGDIELAKKLIDIGAEAKVDFFGDSVDEAGGGESGGDGV